jgi:hypothetical protein
VIHRDGREAQLPRLVFTFFGNLDEPERKMRFKSNRAQVGPRQISELIRDLFEPGWTDDVHGVLSMKANVILKQQERETEDMISMQMADEYVLDSREIDPQTMQLRNRGWRQVEKDPLINQQRTPISTIGECRSRA